ncbi:MAG: hypothetical protein ACRENS_07165 [Candidatus Eiseniibacteriota bacterium]
MRIEKVLEGARNVLRLSGRIESEQIDELKAQIDGSARITVLDLTDVQLVDVEAVRFFAAWESDGIELCNCPQFVREWIVSETPRI